MHAVNLSCPEIVKNISIHERAFGGWRQIYTDRELCNRVSHCSFILTSAKVRDQGTQNLTGYYQDLLKSCKDDLMLLNIFFNGLHINIAH